MELSEIAHTKAKSLRTSNVGRTSAEDTVRIHQDGKIYDMTVVANWETDFWYEYSAVEISPK